MKSRYLFLCESGGHRLVMISQDQAIDVELKSEIFLFISLSL